MPTKKTIVLAVALVCMIALLVILYKARTQAESNPTGAHAIAPAPSSAVAASQSNFEEVGDSIAPTAPVTTRPVAPIATMPAIDAPLLEQLPKLRALSNNGDVEAACKLRVLLADCLIYTSLSRFKRASDARQRARNRLSGQTHSVPDIFPRNGAKDPAGRVDACSEGAPDLYAEQTELLLAEAKKNQPLAIFKLISLPQESLVALALERPELLRAITELTSQQVLSPGEWLAHAREFDLRNLAAAFGSISGPVPAWYREQFEPNQALGYLYLLLATADHASALARFRRDGVENATSENRVQLSLFHALVETEKLLDATTRDAMQTKANQLIAVMQAGRNAQSKRYDNGTDKLDLDQPDAFLKKNLLECEQTI